MSTESLHGETEQSPTPRLIDVIVALRKQGEHEDADYYASVFPLFLSVVYNVSIDEIVMMPIDKLLKLSERPHKPLKYEGWNTFHFGRAAFDNNG